MVFFLVLQLLILLFVSLLLVSSSTMHSLFYLILLFVFTACLLIAQGTEFLALVYLIVYIGAIAVFFLFVIMLINLRREDTTTNMPFGFRLQFHLMLQISLSLCVVICSQL